VLKPTVDPVEGEPPGADQLKVIGRTPPVTKAVKARGDPTLPVDGPLIWTTTFGNEVKVKLPELLECASSPA
jgi:hypothetical protein